MKSVLLIGLIVLAQSAMAGECSLSINRTACAGKEAEALKPYDGKNPTMEKGKATDLEGCTKEGEKAAKIVRKGTLAKKVVAITFDGKAVGEKTDSKECK